MGDETPEPDEVTTEVNGEDEIIEIDYDMISGAKAKRVKALHITERFFKTNFNETHHGPRQLKRIFQDLQQLNDTMETMHVQLETTEITGTMLSLGITSNLMVLDVKSGLTLLNQDDRTALGKVIYEHEVLGEIRLHNLVVKERLLNRWNKHPTPPLDILVPAFASIVFLNVLELSCKEEEPTPPDVVAAPSKPMLSLLGIKELCHSLTLQRLELSRLNLTDDHFGVLVEQLSQQAATSCLTQLILNENHNTDSGLAIVASLLSKSECSLQHLECFQSFAVAGGLTIELFEDALRTNTTLQTLRIHQWGDDELEMGHSIRTKSLIQYYLQLNQKGRKHLLDKQTTKDKWLDLVEKVKDDPSQLYYVLRNSGYWWHCRSMLSMRSDDFVLEIRPGFSPLVSPLRTSERVDTTINDDNNGDKARNRSKSRLQQLKNRHSTVLQGLTLKLHLDGDDDLSEGGESDEKSSDLKVQQDGDEGQEGDIDASLVKELEAQHLPQILSLGHADDMQYSVVSLGAESYIQDLMNQKQKRPKEAREEVLEEALEELDYAVSHDKIPPGMSEELYFHRVLERLSREKAKEELEWERKLDKLLERELLKEIAKEKSAKKVKAKDVVVKVGEESKVVKEES